MSMSRFNRDHLSYWRFRKDSMEFSFGPEEAPQNAETEEDLLDRGSLLEEIRKYHRREYRPVVDDTIDLSFAKPFDFFD